MIVHAATSLESAHRSREKRFKISCTKALHINRCFANYVDETLNGARFQGTDDSAITTLFAYLQKAKFHAGKVPSGQQTKSRSKIP